MQAAKKYDVIIIGAGASGLMCAIEAGRRGQKVLVVDHASSPGAKLKVSGGGRCNLTNLSVGPENYVSQNPHFAVSALSRFTSKHMMDWLGRQGLEFEIKNCTEVFCKQSARAICDLLVLQCKQVLVDFAFGVRVIDVGYGQGFLVKTTSGQFCAQSLVVATGGLSCPKLGATDFGMGLAKKFGHAIVPTRPGLVPFWFAGDDIKVFGGLSGISLPASVACDSKVFKGPLLFTHKGLSGPVCLNASLYWRPNETLLINLFPDGDLVQHLKAKRQTQPRAFLKTVLTGFFPDRVVSAVEGIWFQNTQMAQVSDAMLLKAAKAFTGWTVLPKKTMGFDKAEVTVGGVDTRELSSKTMESKRVKGLYFVGEVVDVTGELGGYNLQWAWSSGWCAGQGV